MIRFLKGNSLGVLVFIFILGMFFSLMPAKDLYIASETNNSIFNGLFNINIKAKSIITYIVGTTIYLISAFYINNLNKKHIIFSERTQMPALFFVLFTGPILFVNLQLDVLISLLLFIKSLDILFTSPSGRKKIDQRFFEAGFIIGVIALINFKLVFVAVTIFITLLVYGARGWREWLTSILGLVLPFAIVFWLSYVFSFNINRNLFSLNTKTLNFNSIPSHYYAHLFVNAILIIMASLVTIGSYPSRKVQSRKSLLIFLWVFIISLFYTFGLRLIGLEALLIIGVPVSYQYAHYFNKVKITRLQNLFLISIIFLCLFIKVFSYLK